MCQGISLGCDYELDSHLIATTYIFMSACSWSMRSSTSFTSHSLSNTTNCQIPRNDIKMPLLYALLQSRNNGTDNPAEPEVDYDLQTRARELTVVEIVMTVVLTFLAGAFVSYLISNIIGKKDKRRLESVIGHLQQESGQLEEGSIVLRQVTVEINKKVTDAWNMVRELAAQYQRFASFRQDFVKTVSPEPQPGE